MARRWPSAAALLAAAAVLAGCAVGPGTQRPTARDPQRDGPPASPPPDLASTPDAEPRIEPVRPGGPNKPYVVLGQSYTPQTGDPVVHERGLASWYGNKFHGRRTASGELYNMYAMTAAHRTLPIPSYARVRNPANGREVIVRVNDRGPFHSERILDLSYTAALKLGLLRGVGTVELERLTFDEIRTGSWRRGADPAGEPARALAQAPAQTPVDAAGMSPPAAAPQPRAAGALLVTDLPPATAGTSAAPTAAAIDATNATNAPTGASASGMVADDPPDRGRAYTDAAEGWWLQLGAFRRLDGAEALRQKVAGDHAALAPLLTVFNESRLYRLQAGPYASRAEARVAAARLRSTLEVAPVIVERR
ncbi:MAG: septal ring lytic transglycosylase RlpA family protein [Burkholderiales bacterium]|nr:septal ring lytic transglycosylase RlpA family protein [Burkholderiales bacterium]